MHSTEEDFLWVGGVLAKWHSTLPMLCVDELALGVGRVRQTGNEAIELLERIDNAHGCACVLPAVRAFLLKVKGG